MRRRGTVIVKDSNKSDWLYVIVSVSHRGRGGGGDMLWLICKITAAIIFLQTGNLNRVNVVYPHQPYIHNHDDASLTEDIEDILPQLRHRLIYRFRFSTLDVRWSTASVVDILSQIPGGYAAKPHEGGGMQKNFLNDILVNECRHVRLVWCTTSPKRLQNVPPPTMKVG